MPPGGRTVDTVVAALDCVWIGINEDAAVSDLSNDTETLGTATRPEEDTIADGKRRFWSIHSCAREKVRLHAQGSRQADVYKLKELRDVWIAAILGMFGTSTAVTASQGFKREWKAQSEMRSPAWTTDIAQVPTVRA